MKNLFKYLFICIFIVSCKSNIEEDPAYKRLLFERDSLAGLVSADVQQINQYLSDFNDIQANLQRIKEAENLVTIKANSTENQLK